jgi:hypothetical protein
MLNEREIESCYLGQFIPVHYHHNMLMDQNRMNAFQERDRHAVKPGMKVLELGGGTGVLSYLRGPAGRQGLLRRVQSRTWCAKRAVSWR